MSKETSYSGICSSFLSQDLSFTTEDDVFCQIQRMIWLLNITLAELQEFWFCLYCGLCVNLWISWISNKKCCIKSATVLLFFSCISNCNCCAISSAEKVVASACTKVKMFLPLLFLQWRIFWLLYPCYYHLRNREEAVFSFYKTISAFSGKS